jgi:hypothetical protein
MNHSQEIICQSVQHNCHVADARHAEDYTMCTYLLKMREYFRWEQKLGCQSPIPREALGNWLSERESLWEDMLGAEFQPVEINGQLLDPFDTEAINSALADYDLVYSAGLTSGAKAHFFLGKLLFREVDGDQFTLYVSGDELARCLNAPPAMTSERSIFLRRQSMHRYLWEQYETWAWSRPDNALGRALACYPFDTSPNEALDAMTEREMPLVKSHELGEHEAGRLLGENWNQMLMELAYTPAELMARAVRDHLADCLCSLPMLAEQNQAPSIHFFMGNQSGMRKLLFPALQLAYDQWLDTGDTEAFARLARSGKAHWLALAEDMMALYTREGAMAAEPVKLLVEARKL